MREGLWPGVEIAQGRCGCWRIWGLGTGRSVGRAARGGGAVGRVAAPSEVCPAEQSTYGLFPLSNEITSVAGGGRGPVLNDSH